MFGHYIDLAKDVILASRLAGILGGITTVFLLYDRFSSMVSFYDCLTARKFLIYNSIYVKKRLLFF